MKQVIPVLLVGLMGMSAIGVARAGYITGTLWENNPNAGNAAIANIPTGPTTTPYVTFTANAVQFSSFGNAGNTGNGSLDYTVGSWLTSLGAANNIVYYNGAASTDPLWQSGGTPCPCNGSFIALTGTDYFTTGQSFTVTQDDGLQMRVGSAGSPQFVFSNPGPTSPVTSTHTYTGNTGDFAFTFAYGECCGAPAVLETNLAAPGSVPEPSTLALLGLGLAGLGFAWRKRKA